MTLAPSTSTAPDIDRDRLATCLRHLRARPDLATLASQVEEIRTLTHADQTAVWQLVDAVLGSPALTATVLRAAAGVRRSGPAVASVTRAVSLLGLGAVRRLAVRHLLHGHFRRLEPIGWMAVGAATLGELALAAYFPADHRRALDRARSAGIPLGDAAREALGFAPGDLAAALIAEWRLGALAADLLDGPLGRAAASETDEPARDLSAPLSAEVEWAVSGRSELALGDIVMLVVEAISRSGRFDRVLFCQLDRQRRHLVARMGTGQAIGTLMRRFRLPVSAPDSPVRPAVVHGENVLVERLSASRYARSAFAAAVRAHAFGLCPVSARGLVTGALYFDRLGAPLGLSSSMRTLFLRLSDQAGVVLASRRAA